MKIFYVNFGKSGCSKWRSEIPAKYLLRRGHTVTALHEGINANCPDVIVFSRQYGSDVFRLYNWAKDRKIRVVYETDDAFDLVDPWNPAYQFSRKHLEETEFMATHADVITTTTPELAKTLRKYNPNVIVIPNSVDPEEWAVRPRNPNERIRIGWMGGGSHFLDLANAADALCELARKLDFTFIIYGLTGPEGPEGVYRKNLEINGDRFRVSPLGKAIKVFLKKTERLPYEFQPFVSTSKYASTLCDLRFDIGLAPLSDTAFNRNKSCIKYYEYSMAGAVTVASNVLPYSAEVPFLCDNTRRAWRERIMDLAKSDLSSIWKTQYDWVMTNRNIEHNVAMWEEALGGSSNVPAISETPHNEAQQLAVV